MADAKGEEKILVVDRKKLFGENDEYYFRGFLNAEKSVHKKRILDNIGWMKRKGEGGAEDNPGFKQPIPYIVIFNPFIKKVFAYSRSKKDKEYGEARLQGKWSWGTGGHINPIDRGEDPIIIARDREIMEEIVFNEDHEVNAGKKILHDARIFGYINDDSNDVGKVHFGLVYIIETNSELITPNPKEKEISKGGLKDYSELVKMCKDPEIEVENWSRIILGPLKEYINPS